MTSDEAMAPGGGTADKTGPLPFDTSVAHQARVYDYMLGGKDNYAADRAAAEAVLKVNPETAFTVRAKARSTIFATACCAGTGSLAVRAASASAASRRNVYRHLDRSVWCTRRSPAI